MCASSEPPSTAQSLMFARSDSSKGPMHLQFATVIRKILVLSLPPSSALGHPKVGQL